MSIEATNLVYARYPASGNERLLAVVLADHARPDGTSIWPSLQRLMDMTRLSRRTVQRLIAKMVSSGWLIAVAIRGGRSRTNEYRIDPAWMAENQAAPLPKKGTTTGQGHPKTGRNEVLLGSAKGVICNLKGVITDVKGVIVVAPEPLEPSRTNTPLPPNGGMDGFFKVFGTYPKKTNEVKARRRWKRLAPDATLQQTMLEAIEAQALTPKWCKDGGRYVPEFATWLRNQGWLEPAGQVMSEWWTTSEGVKAQGARLGLPFSRAKLGNAYTDDQEAAHYRAYRARVFERAGKGPWSESMQLARPPQHVAVTSNC